MIRILLRLIGIKDFEVCASCETLKLQLEIKNQECANLLNTMLGLVKPEVIQQPVLPVKPFSKSVPWGIVKKNLEEKDREEMRIKNELVRQEMNLHKSKSVEELEKELGVNHDEVEKG